MLIQLEINRHQLQLLMVQLEAYSIRFRLLHHNNIQVITISLLHKMLRHELKMFTTHCQLHIKHPQPLNHSWTTILTYKSSLLICHFLISKMWLRFSMIMTKKKWDILIPLNWIQHIKHSDFIWIKLSLTILSVNCNWIGKTKLL